VDGKVDGVVTFWDKEGKVTKTDTYKDGKLLEVIKL
jgi:antitoxin component YwqK of YwqJK toxin-antitoxin module